MAAGTGLISASLPSSRPERVFVRPHVRQFWLYGVGMGRVPPSDIIAYSPTGKDIYFHPDGSLKDIGDHVLNTDLAHTLEMVAQDGADIFYRGEIAERIEHDMKQHGGLMTRPIWRPTRHRISHRLKHVPGLSTGNQPSARWWHHAGRDAEHS